MDYTEYYNLAKPEVATDLADVEVLNSNMDTIDQALYDLAHPESGYFDNIHISQTGYLNEAIFSGDVSFSSDVSFSGDVSFGENVVISGYINHDMVFRTGYYPTVNDMNVVGVEANPADSPTDTLTSVNIGGTVYDISSGGGGSSVTPNPQGTPTDTLSTVEIDGTIFDIAGSGGGSSSTKKDILYTNSTNSNPNTITLSNDFDEYDLLSFRLFRNADSIAESSIYLTVDTQLLSVGKVINLLGWAGSNEYVLYSVSDVNELSLTLEGSNLYIREIAGISFGAGGGAGGGLERTLLWDYVTDNNNVIPYGLYTETLHDDIDNYDFIVAEIVSSSGDLSASGWQGTNLWTIDVNALNNTEVQNYLNYTSFGERSSRFYIKDTTFQKTTDNQGNTNGLVRVYGLKWTGGGSGGDSSYTEVSLFTGTSRVTNMTLSESIKNFDAIEFQAAWMYNGLPYHISSIITSENLSADNYFIIGTNDYRYVELLVVDNTHINWVGGSDNIMYMKEIKGIKYGSGSGRNSEIIPISAGDGTTSRTFTLERTPKKVTLQGYTSGDGGWYESGYFIWGENFMNLIGAQYTIATGGYAGQVAISYGADGKSFTITAANAFGAFNRADSFSGMMLVDYGGGSGSSEGSGGSEVFIDSFVEEINADNLAAGFTYTPSFDCYCAFYQYSANRQVSSTVKINGTTVDSYYFENFGAHSGGVYVRAGQTMTIPHQMHNIRVRVFTLQGASSTGSLDDLSGMVWNEIASTASASSAVAIPPGTRILVVAAVYSGKITIVGKESMTNINKILDVSQLSTYILGGRWADQTGASYGDNSAQISYGLVTAYSSYGTVTTKVYALS